MAYEQEVLDELRAAFSYDPAEGIVRRMPSRKPAYIEVKYGTTPVVTAKLETRGWYLAGPNKVRTEKSRVGRVNARKLVVFLMTGVWPKSHSVKWTGEVATDLRWETFRTYELGTTQVCAGCREVLPVEKFHKNPQRRSGYGSYCIDCSAQRHTEVYPRRRDRAIERTYGLSEGGYQKLHEAQGGVCAICARPQTGKQLAVDYCHDTGTVRGLLCSSCNAALGLLGDDPRRLLEAAKYILAARKAQC